MADTDDPPTAKLDRLAAEIDALDEARDVAEAERYNRWQVTVGPVTLAGYIGSQRLGWLFIGFHALIFGLGIASFFLPGVFPDLGAALVVGSLFGVGAFLAQVWTRQTEREESRAEDEYRQALNEIEQRRRRVAKKLLREIRRLEGPNTKDEHT